MSFAINHPRIFIGEGMAGRNDNGISDRKVELLAPAGNYACFLAALSAGADAVYLAGERFGARAYADNFSGEELIRAIRYAHLFSRRVYLTVNTLLKEAELEGLADYLRPYVDAGLDAVIVQDFGVLSLVRREFPGLSVHCSTQMTITGSEGVRFAQTLGAVRVVPARELSIAEIRQIKADCPAMELECFIHGAMCYCYSGQCLMSSMLGKRSGNRGTCAQPCRLPYDVLSAEKNAYAAREAYAAEITDAARASGREEEPKRYPLSLKDMSLLQGMPELIEAGIDSFKIEGRMKSAEYCAGVTAAYRAVIDRYLRDPAHFDGPTKKEIDLVRGLYIRTDVGEGYYHRYNGKEMLTPDRPSYRGCEEYVLADIRARYMERTPFIPVEMKIELFVGRPARLTLSGAGECVVCTSDPVEAARKSPLTDENIRGQLEKTGATPYKAVKIRIERDDAVFYPVSRLNDLRREALSALSDRLLAGYEERRLQPGPTEHGNEAQRAGGIDPGNEPQRTGGIDPGNKAQRTGGVRPGGEPQRTGGICPGNEAQRTGGIDPGDEPRRRDDSMPGRADRGRRRGYTVYANTLQQVRICMRHPLPDRLLIDPYVYDAYLQSGDEENPGGKEIALWMPRILRRKDIPGLTELTERLLQNDFCAAGDGAAQERPHISGIYVHTPDSYRWAADLVKRLGQDPCEKIFGSPFLYLMNGETARFWSQRLSVMSLSYELHEKEICALLAEMEADGLNSPEMPVYGHIPMMVTANCLVLSFGKDGCTHERGLTILKDRTGQKMPVENQCEYCTNIIYNGVPLSLHKHMPKLQRLYENGRIGSFALYFTVEDAKRTEAVLDYYGDPNAGEWTLGAFTNGHFQRGVM